MAGVSSFGVSLRGVLEELTAYNTKGTGVTPEYSSLLKLDDYLLSQYNQRASDSGNCSGFTPYMFPYLGSLLNAGRLSSGDIYTRYLPYLGNYCVPDCGCYANCTDCGCVSNCTDCSCVSNCTDCGCVSNCTDCGCVSNCTDCGCVSNCTDCGCVSYCNDCGCDSDCSSDCGGGSCSNCNEY